MARTPSSAGRYPMVGPGGWSRRSSGIDRSVVGSVVVTVFGILANRVLGSADPRETIDRGGRATAWVGHLRLHRYRGLDAPAPPVGADVHGRAGAASARPAVSVRRPSRRRGQDRRRLILRGLRLHHGCADRLRRRSAGGGHRVVAGPGRAARADGCAHRPRLPSRRRLHRARPSTRPPGWSTPPTAARSSPPSTSLRPPSPSACGRPAWRWPTWVTTGCVTSMLPSRSTRSGRAAGRARFRRCGRCRPITTTSWRRPRRSWGARAKSPTSPAAWRRAAPSPSPVPVAWARRAWPPRSGCRSLRRGADGVWLVDLSSVTEASLVAPSVASALGTPSSGPDRLADVVDDLGRRHALIILDNCEQLVEACSALVATIMARCPSVAVLVTSREPLGVRGEDVHRLRPLPVSEDAVDLFLDRFAAAGGVGADRSVVSRICERLDGMPLAIELAASRGCGAVGPGDPGRSRRALPAACGAVTGPCPNASAP